MAHAQADTSSSRPGGAHVDQIAFRRRRRSPGGHPPSRAPDEFDWAFAIGRQFLCDHLDLLRLERLGRVIGHQPLAEKFALAAEERRCTSSTPSGWMVPLGHGAPKTPGAAGGRLPQAGRHDAAGAGLPGGAARRAGRLRGRADLLGPGVGAQGPRQAGVPLAWAPSRRKQSGAVRGTPRHCLLDEMCEVLRLEPEARPGRRTRFIGYAPDAVRARPGEPSRRRREAGDRPGVQGVSSMSRRRPIVVVTINSMAEVWPHGSIRMAELLFDHEIGAARPHWNTGILLLVSKGDRKATTSSWAAGGSGRRRSATRSS